MGRMIKYLGAASLIGISYFSVKYLLRGNDEINLKASNPTVSELNFMLPVDNVPAVKLGVDVLPNFIRGDKECLDSNLDNFQ